MSKVGDELNLELRQGHGWARPTPASVLSKPELTVDPVSDLPNGDVLSNEIVAELYSDMEYLRNINTPEQMPLDARCAKKHYLRRRCVAASILAQQRFEFGAAHESS